MDILANTRRWPSVDLMLARRLGRPPTINSTLGERHVIAGIQFMYSAVQNQNAVAAYFTGKQLQHFGFAKRYFLSNLLCSVVVRQIRCIFGDVLFLLYCPVFYGMSWIFCLFYRMISCWSSALFCGVLRWCSWHSLAKLLPLWSGKVWQRHKTAVCISHQIIKIISTFVSEWRRTRQ